MPYILLLLPVLLLAGCGAGSSGITGPFEVYTVTVDSPGSVSGSPGATLLMSASPAEQTVRAGGRALATIEMSTRGVGGGAIITLNFACPAELVCPPNRQTSAGDKPKSFQMAVDVPLQTESGRYTVTVRGHSPSVGGVGSFSGNSASFVIVVEAAAASAAMERRALGLQAPPGKPVVLRDYEGLMLDRPLVLRAQGGEATETLMLWREAYPFPALVLDGEVLGNTDGSLGGAARLPGWGLGWPLALRAGDLNRDGSDDVVYFSALAGDWFALVLADGEGGLAPPVVVHEAAGVLDAAVADINLDGEAEVVVLTGGGLVAWFFGEGVPGDE